MALELKCFNISSSLPAIPTNNTLTNLPSHSYYNPNGRAITQLISSSLTRLTFSTNDVRSFLEQVTSDNIQISDVSTIVKLKPITSTIIYCSITLALFIVLSIVFCIISCSNCCKRQTTERSHRRKKRKCSRQCICVVLILLISLLVIGQMIYIAYQVNRTKIFLDNSIREINEEIYPKEISIYLQHLLEQLKELDQYSTQTDSILIKASHSMFVKAFDQIFREKYFFDEIRQSAINSNRHIMELDEVIDQELDLSNVTNSLVHTIQDDNKRLFDDLEKPLQELCDYANGSDTDIDKISIDALSQVHEQLTKLIDTIQKDFLDRMPSGINATLIEKNLEDQIRWYINLVGIILLVFVIVIGLVPIIFIILIIMCRLCHCRQNDRTRGSQSPSSAVLCCMRIFFIPILIILIVIVLVSGVLYLVDLFAHGACRTVHDDQPFLISFLIDKLVGSNSSDLIIGGADVETTVLTIIDDCGHQIHFTKHLLENHLSRFDNINSTKIQQKIQQIENDLTNIQIRFDNITGSEPTLPVTLVNQTIKDFRSYLDKVLESTLDTCPLPLAIIYKADTLVCHDLAMSINGLWLSLFVYIFLITFGLCIIGLCIYKRFQSLPPKPSIPDIYQHRF